MTRARQPDLFPRQPTPAPRTTEAGRGGRGIEPFEFVPGPECEPRPDWVIPAELRLPTDPDEVTK